jgi:hypothetical protein
MSIPSLFYPCADSSNFVKNIWLGYASLKFLQHPCKKIRIISKFVENQRAGLFRIPCDFMGPEENPASAGLLAIMRRISLRTGGGGIGYFFEAY